MNTLYKVYCRTFQAVMKLGHHFLNYRIPETIKGAGTPEASSGCPPLSGTRALTGSWWSPTPA